MSNEKKIWLIEQYAQKAWTVSLVLSQEAARAGEYGKGYAVVAHEARMLADKMHSYASELRFENANDDMFKNIVNCATMFKFLSVNAAIEILHMVDISMDFNIPKSMSVFAEELRRIAISLGELADENLRKKPLTIPELASHTDTAGTGRFFLYSICGHPLIENADKIIEVVLYPRKAIAEDKTFSIRGEQLPILDCRKLLDIIVSDADEQTVIVINPEGKKSGKNKGLHAVPIDDLDVNAIFYSRLGLPVLPSKKHAFAEYARECWDVVGGDQVVFVDWRKLIEANR